MEPIKIKNWAHTVGCSLVLAACGVVIAVMFGASYWEKYYDELGFALLEVGQTVLTVIFAFWWWRCAATENVKRQNMRMWISEHGAAAPWIGFIPVALVAGVAHLISLTSLTEGTSGAVTILPGVLPCLYVGLYYWFPPVEVSETIVGLTGVFHEILRIFIGALFVGLAVFMCWYDFA